MRMGRVDRVSKLMVIVLSLMLAVPFMTFFSSEEASAGEVLSDIAGATYAHSKGYDGTGILIGEVGTGLDTGDNATLFGDFAGRVEHFVDWAEVNDADGVAEDAFGMSTPFVSWMAGDDSTGQFDPVDGKLYGLGMAPGASIMTERIFDDTGTPAAVNIADVFTDACQRGAYAMTNSWGGGANYEYGSISNLIDTATRDADTAAPGDQPLLLFMASGNTDIMESGCSKNGITVGVSEGYKPHKGPDADNIEELWTSSPSGPTADGRIKPDIVAPATWGAGARSHDPGAAGFTGWEAVNADYLYTAGSGGSSAVGCGGAAVFAQYYNDINGALPSPAMTKAAMINGATDMDTADIPNSNEGWGRLNLTNMIDPGFDIFYDDQNILLETGGSQIYDSLNVNDASQPLKITVVWTDVPAPPTTGTGAALINDLDLTAISPGGQVYYGNFFVGGWAVPDIPIVDTVNNEECVYVQTPELGLWTIYVNGTDVQQDAISATGEIDQDYAFIISGSFDIGGGPVVDYGYADPNPTNGAATTTVYAGFSDSQNIADAEYFIDVTGDNGTGTAMTPSDGAFDEPDEDAYADLDIGALGWLPGETHTIYVHAQDSNTEWGSFFPITIFVGTQYFLHVENSIGVDMSLWTTAPDEVAIITNTTGPMPTAGDYQVGTQAWITDPLAADTDVSGTWRFFMNGYVTTDEAAGFLYAKVYEHSTMTLLNPAPEQCPTNISGTYSYYEFEWTETMPAATISAGDRIYMEIWLDNPTDAGGAGTSVYNYSGIIEATGPHYAYFCDVNDISSPTGPSLNSFPEFTTAQYGDATGSDDFRAESLDPSAQDEVFTWCNFEIVEDPATVTQLDMTFEGHGVAATDFQIWVRDSTNVWTQVGTAVSALAGTDVTITRSITSNCADYFPGNVLTWGCYQTDSTDLIRVDHLEIEISYGQPPPEFILGYDNDSASSRIIVPELVSGDSPPVSSCSYAGASPTGANPITIDWTATDDNGLVQVELFYQFDGGGYFSWADGTNPAAASGIADSGSWSFDFPDGFGTYDFYTRASDDAPQTEVAPGTPDVTVEYAIVVTYDIPISGLGWQFISFPIEAPPAQITTMLNDVTNGDGNTEWDRAMWWDASDPTDHWKTYNTNYPGTQDMPLVSNEMGIWLNITRNDGDGLLTIGVDGPDPVDKTINLLAGWNMVGYPGMIAEPASDVLPPEVTKIAIYNSSQPYDMNEVPINTVTMSEGNAYWLYSTANVPWVVEGQDPIILPYTIMGFVHLYDGFGGWYNPKVSTGGATVSIQWLNRATGTMDTINTFTDGLGRYMDFITNYYDGDVVYVNATFDAPYWNNGYNYTYIDTGMGLSNQNVTCGVPYDIIFFNPPPMSPVISGVPFLAEYMIVDRDGMLAQGYFEWGDGFMEWFSSDPTFFPPVPGLPFDGTSGPSPGQRAAMLTLNTIGMQTIEIYEGFPPGNMYLTPWGEFYIDPDNTIPGWFEDFDIMPLDVI